MLAWLTLLGWGCAPGEVPGPEAPPGDDDTGARWWTVAPGDLDGDGRSAEDGDCDDGRADVAPGRPDICDGADNDCDGLVDEDAPGADDVDPVQLGPQPDEVERLVFPTLSPEGDEDTVTFEVVDGLFSLFDIEVYAYHPAADLDVALELAWVSDPSGRDRGVVASADDHGSGGFETLEWAGVAGQDDSGTYALRVRAVSGASCAAPLTVQILLGGW